MRFKLFLYFICLCSFTAYSQEICNNALDDDNDGLIDLNDPDCICNNSTNVPSLIPNPSFENYDFCPNGISQLDFSETWIQATTPTTDYFNTCGYVNNAGMLPFPDGNAAVGAFFIPGWQEYLGACLLNPMLAGTNYQFQFHIASKPATPDVDLGNNGIIDYGPVDVTLYGSATCNYLPLNTVGCPSEANSNWIVLGSAHYTPVGQWGILTISFTPTTNINAIMIGSPCTLPSDYTSHFGSGEIYSPYFYFDNLILNKTSIFNLANTISSSGDPCSNNVVLSSTNTDTTYSYQWYLNGIAIPNATSPTYHVTSFGPADSYTLRLSIENYCTISNNLVLNIPVPAKPIVSSPVNLCQYGLSSALNATGNNLKWYTQPSGGIPSTTAPIPSTATAGTFTFYVSQTCGLESPRESITVVVNPLVTPNFSFPAQLCFESNPPTLGTISPNGVSGTWMPNTINTIQNGNYTFSPNPNQCATNQNINIAIIPPLDYTIIGECDNGNYLLSTDHQSTDWSNYSFDWFGPQQTSIGTNQPSIDITALTEASSEIEVFPSIYGVHITDNNGCITSKTYTIESAFCKIPQGISPNGDDTNESFDLTGWHVKRLEIFNRYGTKVYSQENYTDQWRGQSDNGGELPDATYFYYIEFEDVKPKTGWVYLTR